MSRPLVPDFGPASDDLRGGTIADFGVSGWIEALSLGSAVDGVEDRPVLEFWADAIQIKVVATAANKKAILRFVIKNLQFRRSH